MCFGGGGSAPQRDPQIDAEQQKAREEAEAAKAAAQAEKEKQRQKLLEQEKEAAAAKARKEASGRQDELSTPVGGELTPTGLKRSKRGKSRGRASLMTSSGGGIGYYNEYL